MDISRQLSVRLPILGSDYQTERGNSPLKPIEAYETSPVLFSSAADNFMDGGSDEAPYPVRVPTHTLSCYWLPMEPWPGVELPHPHFLLATW